MVRFRATGKFIDIYRDSDTRYCALNGCIRCNHLKFLCLSTCHQPSAAGHASCFWSVPGIDAAHRLLCGITGQRFCGIICGCHRVCHLGDHRRKDGLQWRKSGVGSTKTWGPYTAPLSHAVHLPHTALLSHTAPLSPTVHLSHTVHLPDTTPLSHTRYQTEDSVDANASAPGHCHIYRRTALWCESACAGGQHLRRLSHHCYHYLCLLFGGTFHRQACWGAPR